ncbi:uncharacterized protein [Venturia canescens]|uniref:uncharacterized protein isoform X2 n=1 Tax=Venturia canescens TaxID=32260 RepID=UPI001C9CEEB0|nr:uncharacterized protein LOC122406578 isoform X2 [Venturia canescens]
MEKNAYFEGVNHLNAFINFLSGHCLPLSDDPKKLSFLDSLWLMFAWSVKMLYLTTAVLGTLHFANLTADQAFKKSGAIAMLTIEVLIPLLYLNFRRSDLRKLIKNYNLILIDCDDLRQCVCQTVKHYNAGLSFFFIAGLFPVVLFPAAPIFRIFESEQFTYADFTVPAYLPGEPFGRSVFAAGVAIQVVGGCILHTGVIAIYLYVIHYIAVLMGQYKYVRIRIAEAFSEKDDPRDDLSVITALRECVDHHSAVIKVGQTLIGILAFHIGVTYITCIMEFCFLAYGVITFGNAIVEKFTYMIYIFFRILLSTSVTDDAFHENWYTRSKTVQKIFFILQLSSQMECRVSAYRIVDLVVPTLALILSKSYSVCLLLLNIK